MAADVWKEFEHNPVTHSAAHHLIAIAELRESRGYARVSDVARELNITRGSASLTLKTLKQRGLVLEDENRFLLLSKEGEALAAAVRGKKFLLQRFLSGVLGVPAEQADIDACKMEHLISDEAAHQLARFLRAISSDHVSSRVFLETWQQMLSPCNQDPAACPVCELECINTQLDDCTSHES